MIPSARLGNDAKLCRMAVTSGLPKAWGWSGNKTEVEILNPTCSDHTLEGIQNPGHKKTTWLLETIQRPSLLLVRFLISWYRQMLLSPNFIGILKWTEVTLAQHKAIDHKQCSSTHLCVQVASWEPARLAWFWNVGQNWTRDRSHLPGGCTSSLQLVRSLRDRDWERTKDWKWLPLRTRQRKESKKD